MAAAAIGGLLTLQFCRHRLVGHVFQGRYKAILVQKESYLLELARYIVLNPVRAHLVQPANEWAWSSYQSTIGEKSIPVWLDRDWLLGQFGNNSVDACAAYKQFMSQASTNRVHCWMFNFSSCWAIKL